MELAGKDVYKRQEQHRALEQDAAQIKTDRALTGALIERLIDRIEVSHDKQITVRYRFQSEFETYAEVQMCIRDSLVLDNGRLVEHGTHDELMKKNGLYHKLFHIQQESLGWAV